MTHQKDFKSHPESSDQVFVASFERQDLVIENKEVRMTEEKWSLPSGEQFERTSSALVPLRNGTRYDLGLVQVEWTQLADLNDQESPLFGTMLKLARGQPVSAEEKNHLQQDGWLTHEGELRPLTRDIILSATELVDGREQMTYPIDMNSPETVSELVRAEEIRTRNQGNFVEFLFSNQSGGAKSSRSK